ncbi:prepilin peptidase [Marinactinospora rubrisoli]|uniref:Prepilin peptidase n=1 Tax=Marinactinospora rubrisoli TaxID=2715399 RepID=A0ABW2KJT6_9ACTN
MPAPADIVLPVTLAALGAGLGAVLGTVLGRVVPLFHAYEYDPDDDSGPPPPTCPHCGGTVPWPRWSALPVRFVTTGRCPGCGTTVRSPRTVAVLAAVVLAVLGVTGSGALPGGAGAPAPMWAPLELVAFGFFGLWGVLLAVIDARTHRLPNPLVLPAYPVALALLVAAAATTPGGGRALLSALAGMAALAAGYWLLWFIHPAGMGWGDVKLSGLLGLYLGWTGLGTVLSGTFVAFLLSASYGLVLIALRRATRKSQIPFGPFMILGALGVIVAGDPLPALLG